MLCKQKGGKKYNSMCVYVSVLGSSAVTFKNFSATSSLCLVVIENSMLTFIGHFAPYTNNDTTPDTG